MSHHLLVNRRYTIVAQRLPEEYIEEQQNFLSYIYFKRTEYNYPLNLMGNIDEMPIAFNMPNQTTIEKSRTRTISILTTSHEYTCFIFSDGVYVHANLCGSNPCSLLILDSFTAHRTDPVKCCLKERNTDIAVIPSRLTSHLQPLDVSLNKAFKAKGAWDNIDPAMIRRSFKYCGVSTEMDSSEDSSIFDFEVSSKKKRRISIEEEGKSNELGSENIEDVEDNESNNDWPPNIDQKQSSSNQIKKQKSVNLLKNYIEKKI
ncbi:7500_t:CDS:2 [Scutellospora calospora]|uniref:7500_t:CDS:1 n=1 Tax=Scutellospora calospora TaxID=85575 RepID=A0ACA9K5R6_9GLOM|nr:7500_t:CDS:2 [Scutellospora calospora]